MKKAPPGITHAHGSNWPGSPIVGMNIMWWKMSAPVSEKPPMTWYRWTELMMTSGRGEVAPNVVGSSYTFWSIALCGSLSMMYSARAPVTHTSRLANAWTKNQREVVTSFLVESLVRSHGFSMT